MSARALAGAAALIRWQRAAGPYWPFVDATPFISGQLAAAQPRPSLRNARLHPSTLAVLRHLSELSGVAAFADLSPEAILPATSRLCRAGFYVLPAVPRWCEAPAAVPSAHLVSLLLSESRRVTSPRSPSGALFLLDGRRAGPDRLRGRRPLRAFDNRYTNSLNGLPGPEFLQLQGITRAIWFARAPEVAHDLLPYVQLLSGAGLPLDVVPLPR